MKYQLIAAGAALAPLAAASNVNRRDWGWNKNNDNNVAYVTEIDVVTVDDIVTVFGDAPAAQTSDAAAPSPVETPVDSSSVVTAAATSDVIDSSSVAATPSDVVQSSSSAAAVASAPASTSAQSANVMVATSKKHTHTAKATTTVVTKASSAEAAPTVAAATSAAAASGQATAGTSSSSSSGKNITTSSLSPNGKKAGLSGYVGIQQMQAFKDLSPYISWYSDYTADTPSSGDVMGVGMLWAASGSGCGSEVTNRVNTFDAYVTDNTPEIMFGFYEPDCNCPDSSAMSTSQGQAAWNSMIAPLKSKGTVLGSPSMCKQKDENWLTPFKSNIAQDWDVTSVHINKPNITGVKQDIEYYAATYGKPIWVSEFACVNDHDTWAPCTDQDQINQFIKDAVAFFQANDSVVAYGPSNGNGLGTTWPLTGVDGSLTESGTTYLNAIKNL